MKRAGWLLVLILAVSGPSSAAIEMRSVALPGAPLAMMPARDAQGTPGLALLFAKGEERSLSFLDPATGRLEVLAAKLPEEAASLHSFDFGNGPRLLVGGQGILYSVGPDGALEKILEDPGFTPGSLRDATGTLKAYVSPGVSAPKAFTIRIVISEAVFVSARRAPNSASMSGTAASAATEA